MKSPSIAASISRLWSLILLLGYAPARHYFAWALSQRGLPCLDHMCISVPTVRCRYLIDHTPHGELYSRPSMHLFSCKTQWSCTSHTSSDHLVSIVYAVLLYFSRQVSATIKSKSLRVYWIQSGLIKGQPRSASKIRKLPGTILPSAHHSTTSAHKAISQSSECLSGLTQQWCLLSLMCREMRPPEFLSKVLLCAHSRYQTS